MLTAYSKVIADQERRGFVEKIPDASPLEGHFIPHHAVRKESSTTPIRVVYDCSCRISHDHPSLNDCLESTPPDLNDIATLLVRFRLRRYAVTTDIEKAFLHVGLHENDRDFARFLWLENPMNPNSELVTYRFKVVLFGATSSPFMLNATILKHLKLNQHVHAAGIIMKDLYVDNVVSSFDEELQLTRYYREARKLMLTAGMNLRSWTSNNPILRQLAADDNVQDTDEITKVLGLRWKPTTDTMTFAPRNFPLTQKTSKRGVLKFASQVYDPLGLLSPITVRTKLLMQRLWNARVDWDSPLTADDQQTWNSIASDLNSVISLDFDRSYFQDSSENSQDIEMHLFVDASVHSYGAAAYVCTRTESSLVMARNKVAPMKKITLPQLELMAALIGARLAKYLSEAIDVTHLTFWSDSQIVLYWLSTTKPLKKFVANRVTEIRTLTDICSWRYCPTRDNPADLLTRGISATKFIGNKLWTSGPAWLCNHDKWPIWKTNNFVLQTIIDEQQIPEHHNDKTATSDSDLNMIDFTRYSTYRKLLHVMGYILRYFHNCRHSKNDRNSGPLSVQETKNAEQTLIKICQYTAFQDVIAALHTHKSNPLVRQLRLYIDCTGLIRCSGRIHNAPLDFDTKFPVLLPKKHHLTKLIVRDAHARSQHSGGNATTTLLRTKYWIPAIRQVVKSVIRKCVTCRKVSGQPYRAPNVAPLPTIRVTEGPPFSITGVDFTGALYIKQTRESLESKAYICLFTCANTRAIHLEVVSSLSEEVFLLALRRFVSRRSTPNIIISDNATTFQAAATYLRKLFDSTTVRDTLTNLGIQWQFIPKRAPWYGGFWERLIGLTKLALKKVLGKAYINLETLQTIVTEIEATINDRPLTTVSPDMGDPEPLTPAHLLHGRRMTSLPHSNNLTTADVRSSKLDIQNRAKRVTNLLDQYWKRWKTDYLTALREYHQKTGTNQQTISVGDVVLVHDDTARSTWKLATIEETLPGNDGMIRAARIRTQNGLYTTRPIVKLYPLEVINDNDNS